jgi:hypothetical protein
MLALSFDEVIQVFDTPAQQEVNTVSYFPLQDFEDALFCDLESEEQLEEPLDVLIPSCYGKSNGMVDNIYEFIHFGKHKWDVIGYDGDPIYEFKGSLNALRINLLSQYSNLPLKSCWLSSRFFLVPS